MNPLQTYIAPYLEGGLCIAFSGGVDSAVLLQTACALGKERGIAVYAVTFDTALHPKADAELAKQLADQWGAVHHVIAVNELDNPSVLTNPPDRCYQCKGYLFKQLLAFCQVHGLQTVMDGTNFDDLSQYRPGLRALQELGIRSPLAELGMDKATVRALAQTLGISVAKRPSAPCLATRLPYGSVIEVETLQAIARGEAYLAELGFAVNRIRLHGQVARIELLPSQFATFMTCYPQVVERLQALGFGYITLDLEGFRSGSMDVYLKEDVWTQKHC